MAIKFIGSGNKIVILSFSSVSVVSLDENYNFINQKDILHF